MKIQSAAFSAFFAFLTLPVFAQTPAANSALPIGSFRIPIQSGSGLLQEAIPVPAASASGHFYAIQLRHYDASMMANLITQSDGIIVVPPNYVFSSAMPANGFPQRQGVRPPAAGAAPRNPAASPVLPIGIKRIYALESNNSLVIETTP